jgi:hypothetical protein
MSGASSSSELGSGLSARADISADAALILAALGRMETVVRDERAAFDRLRAMLGEMAHAIAKAKAVADSETAATLLNELEHRVDAMIDIAGGHPAVAAAAAIPEPQPEAAAAPAPDASAAAEAIQPPAEHDQVPTVSGVVGPGEIAPSAAADVPPVDEGISTPTVAMLTAMVEALRDSIAAGPEPETTAAPKDNTAAETAEAVETAPIIEAPQPDAAAQTEEAAPIGEVAEIADHSPAPEAAQRENPIFAILNARLAALSAAAAAAPEPEALSESTEPAPPAAEEAVPQHWDVVPQPETSIESAEAAAPATETVETVAAADLVAAPQADETLQTADPAHIIEAAEPAERPAPTAEAPDNGPFVAMLRARMDALRTAVAAAAQETQGAVESSVKPETSSIESAAEAALAAEIVQAVEAASVSETSPVEEVSQAVEPIDTVEVAAPMSHPVVSDVHESALLASLEQMGSRPFPPPDVGTAVIFTPKPEIDFLSPGPKPAVVAPRATEPAAIEQTAPAQTFADEPKRPEPTMAEILADLNNARPPAPAQPTAVEIAAANVQPTAPLEPAPAEPAAVAPPAEAMAVAETADSDFDPAELFEPEPEPDPAPSLLEPAPHAKTAAQPQPAEPAAKEPEAAQPVEPVQPAQAAPGPAPHDPLRALKAMSENEKIALFS